MRVVWEIVRRITKLDHDKKGERRRGNKDEEKMPPFISSHFSLLFSDGLAFIFITMLYVVVISRSLSSSSEKQKFWLTVG